MGCQLLHSTRCGRRRKWAQWLQKRRVTCLRPPQMYHPLAVRREMQALMHCSNADEAFTLGHEHRQQNSRAMLGAGVTSIDFMHCYASGEEQCTDPFKAGVSWGGWGPSRNFHAQTAAGSALSHPERRPC